MCARRTSINKISALTRQLDLRFVPNDHVLLSVLLAVESHARGDGGQEHAYFAPMRARDVQNQFFQNCGKQSLMCFSIRTTRPSRSYRSNTYRVILEKGITRLSLLQSSKDGTLDYLQFLEDTAARRRWSCRPTTDRWSVVVTCPRGYPAQAHPLCLKPTAPPPLSTALHTTITIPTYPLH